MDITTSTSPVKNIMTDHLYVLNIKDPITKAVQMFREHHIRHLPVVNNNQIVGIMSKTDVLRLSFGDNFFDDTDLTFVETLKTEDVMRRNPHTVNENECIRDVARKLMNEDFHALPVVNEKGICGILTTTDIIQYFLDLKTECNHD